MNRAVLALEIVAAVLVSVAVWMGGGVSVVVSPWLGVLVGAAFVMLFAIAWER